MLCSGGLLQSLNFGFVLYKATKALWGKIPNLGLILFKLFDFFGFFFILLLEISAWQENNY